MAVTSLIVSYIVITLPIPLPLGFCCRELNAAALIITSGQCRDAVTMATGPASAV